MGNGYNHHFHHQNLHNKTTYLPILCSRPSIKDVHISKWHDHSTTTTTTTSDDPSLPRVSCVGQVKIIRNNKATIIPYPTNSHKLTTTTTTSDDPSSPRVSCVGQVKNIRNNKATIIPYPTNSHRLTTTTTTTKDNHNIRSYSKLKRLFSTKNLSTSTSCTTSVSCRREIMIMGTPRRRSKFRDENSSNYVPANVADMDPPLPVIKKVQQPGEGRDEVNLWKRRSAHGMTMKSLQIQQIHIPNNHFLQPTTV